MSGLRMFQLDMGFGLKELQRVKMREDTKIVGLFMNEI